MQIAIASPQPKRKLELGDVIVAKHLSTSKALYYQLIRLGRSGKYYLLNMNTNVIMESFESAYPQSAIDYVEVATKSKVMEIVPSSKLTLTLGQVNPTQHVSWSLDAETEKAFHEAMTKHFPI